MNNEILIKDDTYYFADGNKEFHVGDHLFKLHGSILRLHSNFFRNMFELPQASDQEFNDEAMVCDDSPDAFQALCWVLYAGPIETAKESEVTATNVRKIAHIGLLAHKYEFSEIEEWIINICNKLPLPETLMGFPLEDLKYFAHVIYHCDWKKVKSEFYSRIVDGVFQEKNLSSITSASTLSKAVEVADHIGDDKLRAHAYYCFLESAGWDLHIGERQDQRRPIELDDMTEFSTIISLSSLSEKQQLCLFRGFSSLRTLRARLRYMPVLEPFPSTCDSTERRSCYGRWTSWWLTHAERLDASVQMDGPWEFLDTMLARATSEPPSLPSHANSQTKECIGHIVAQVTELKRTLGRDLPNYFR